jgi:hypothetical protein
MRRAVTVVLIAVELALVFCLYAAFIKQQTWLTVGMVFIVTLWEMFREWVEKKMRPKGASLLEVNDTMPRGGNPHEHSQRIEAGAKEASEEIGKNPGCDHSPGW